MKIPRLKTNPAAGLIADVLDHERLTAAEACRAMRIPRSRLSDIFAGRKGVSADTALRMERFLGTSSALLMRLQTDYDLSRATQEKGGKIEEEVCPRRLAA